MSTNSLREAAQRALEALEFYKGCYGSSPAEEAIIAALRAALAEPPTNQCGETCERAKLCAVCARGLAEPVQEPWGTRERFYEAIDRAVENVKQEMRIKTVTMRLPEYDVAMPIIDAYSGHVLVGPVPTPPQRKPLTEEEIRRIKPVSPDLVDFRSGVRCAERAHKIGNE